MVKKILLDIFWHLWLILYIFIWSRISFFPQQHFLLFQTASYTPVALANCKGKKYISTRVFCYADGIPLRTLLSACCIGGKKKSNARKKRKTSWVLMAFCSAWRKHIHDAVCSARPRSMRRYIRHSLARALTFLRSFFTFEHLWKKTLERKKNIPNMTSPSVEFRIYLFENFRWYSRDIFWTI